MDILQNLGFFLVAFFVAIFILVSVHEFGHFYVARLCGVKVLRFCIGMGKPFWSVTDRHGTEFGLAPIPLGGYVKMLGENDDDVSPEEKHLSFHHKKVYQRIAILSAGPLANFLFAILIFWGVLFFSGSIGLSPVIGHVEKGSLAEQAGLNEGQEIVAIDGVATETRMDVLEHLFARLGETGTLDITVKQLGSELRYESELHLQDWMVGESDPDPIAGLGLKFYAPAVMLGDIQPGGAGEEGGLKAGDVVLSTDDQSTLYTSEWVKYVQTHVDKKITLVLLRDGSKLTLDVVPRPVVLEDGSVVGQLGVAVTTEEWPKHMVRRQSFSFFESFFESVAKTWNKSVFVLVSLQKLIVGEISTKNLSGPIGIAKVAGDYAKAGVSYYIEFLAFLSITLGVMNLLPIPILDGGHIVFCLIEAVKGGPVSEKIQSLGFSLGLAVLAAVMVTAFYYDILRLF